MHDLPFQPLQEEAKAFMAQHDWTAAIPLLERDIIVHPSGPWSRMFLGSCHLELKRFDRALDCFQVAESLAPGLSTPVGCQGDALWAAGERAKAGDFYRRALQLEPDDELAQKNWGWWNEQTAKA